MGERELQQFEYFLIRIAPDPIRNEYLNIGVALYDPNGNFAAIRMVRDYQRIRCLFPGFDAADLAGLEEDLQQRLLTRDPHWVSRNYLMEWAQECFAQTLQLTAPNAVLTRDPVAELEHLYGRYAAPPQAPAGESLRAGPRRTVLRRLQQVFEEEHLLARLRRNQRIADLITDPDPFRFDFYYKPNGVHHFIQAVALGGSDTGIKELSFTAGRLQRLLTGPAAVDITAVIDTRGEDDRDEIVTARQFHEELLRDAGIQLVPIEQARELAGRVKRELQLG